MKYSSRNLSKLPSNFSPPPLKEIGEERRSLTLLKHIENQYLTILQKMFLKNLESGAVHIGTTCKSTICGDKAQPHNNM
jgi:hypothetical protein